MENGVATTQGVRDNTVRLKYFIPVSLLPTRYPVRDETGKKGEEFFTMIFSIKCEAKRSASLLHRKSSIYGQGHEA